MSDKQILTYKHIVCIHRTFSFYEGSREARQLAMEGKVIPLHLRKYVNPLHLREDGTYDLAGDDNQTQGHIVVGRIGKTIGTTTGRIGVSSGNTREYVPEQEMDARLEFLGGASGTIWREPAWVEGMAYVEAEAAFMQAADRLMKRFREHSDNRFGILDDVLRNDAILLTTVYQPISVSPLEDQGFEVVMEFNQSVLLGEKELDYEVVSERGEYPVKAPTTGEWGSVLRAASEIPIVNPFDNPESGVLTLKVRDVIGAVTWGAPPFGSRLT